MSNNPIVFDPFYGWVDVTDRNNIPNGVRVIGASDLLRFEHFAAEAAAAINSLGGSVNDAAVAGVITDPGSATRQALHQAITEEASAYPPARLDGGAP